MGIEDKNTEIANNYINSMKMNMSSGHYSKCSEKESFSR